ncbi:glycyl-radical enzyme activating protein [Bifidobacterium sp. ESL0769]|uniref:glycyl-radical enzyme activating protein n=1 Tax=Bifidobacterium sp. ESL0769 TaxID=2983229 RepID=UPI0023F83E05|nr:glycyl-radical enzyme activating protein [Bifidobacterium sp. ESL0769]WEV68151.1 glycyl-radical enzyme activating protein [Bifidobacterium sp. ESL0769]
MGRVFNIQRFSIHDGPGIRTVVFLKGCSYSCTWCANPEGIKSYRQVMFSSKKCIECGLCVEAAQNGEVEMQNGKLVLHRERIRPSQLEWVKACPTGALKIVGDMQSAEEVTEKVLRDMPFYRRSGQGGVTFSGGEPLVQARFVDETAGLCKEHGLHTAVETAAGVPLKSIVEVSDNIDLFICSLTSTDPETYRKYMGHSNETSLANIRWMARYDPERLCVRSPLIPGVNMENGQVEDMIEFLTDAGVKYYDVLPFHRLGTSKYTGLGRAYDFAKLDPPSDQSMEEIRGEIRRHGMSTDFPKGLSDGHKAEIRQDFSVTKRSKND